MKSYGLDLQHTDINSNADLLVSGPAFPGSPPTGSIFFLTSTVGDKTPGGYIFNGTEWVSGDISSVTVGPGLIGGGDSGDIAISLDANTLVNVIPTAAPITTLSPETSNSAGASTSFSKSDHTHEISGFLTDAVDPVALAIIFGS